MKRMQISEESLHLQVWGLVFKTGLEIVMFNILFTELKSDMLSTAKYHELSAKWQFYLTGWWNNITQ